MTIKTFGAACLMVIAVSFIGFLTENIWLFLTKHTIDNRNMTLPFLFGYGLTAIALYFIIGIPDGTHDVKYFISASIIVMLGEITLGTAVEHICHINYWNYSWIPLHITKYTSIPTTFLFATAITIFMGRFWNPMMGFFLRIESTGIYIFAAFFAAVLFVDMLHSFIKMYQNKALYYVWQIEFKSKDYIKVTVFSQSRQSQFQVL
jgi:uncharacterized membrane protein